MSHAETPPKYPPLPPCEVCGCDYVLRGIGCPVCLQAAKNAPPPPDPTTLEDAIAEIHRLRDSHAASEAFRRKWGLF